MSPDKVFGLYVFCADYHSGQWSRLYKLLCRIGSRYHPKLSSRAEAAIRGSRRDLGDEWEGARRVYRHFAQKYGGKV